MSVSIGIIVCQIVYTFALSLCQVYRGNISKILLESWIHFRCFLKTIFLVCDNSWYGPDGSIRKRDGGNPFLSKLC